MIPNIHPNRTAGNIPESAVGQAGWYMADTACPISYETWNSALASANTAVGAAQAVLDGQNSAYALCRPPGHHAFADLAGGFCFLNNSAIAAQHLRFNFQKVAILDVDVHHGNGTQSIFYQLEELREQDRSENTWQIIRTLKKEKLHYKDQINRANQTILTR